MKNPALREMTSAALLCWLVLSAVSAIAGGSDRLGVFSGPVSPTATNPGGVNQPGVTQPDVTKPYYYQPRPNNLNSMDELRLKTYRDQLYWQQQNLRLRQSSRPLNPQQQRILNQTQQESDRVNSLLAPSLKTPLPSPGVGTTVLPPPLIPAR
jgi:hypothetical protein